ncbi:unnamed protein product [Lactuca saligna]|uniref:Uncharacterized protein n=1 Tax=Lactuca saligna TaxID=75948 RepID=A0AA35ZMV1_LACSI|nr:unnamed protein product [Lactuca saligna]
MSCLQQLDRQIVGSIGVVAVGLDLGKEGPLVHIVACIASLLGQGGPDDCKFIPQAPPDGPLVKKGGMPPGPRAGFSMCVHKKRTMLFGEVFDMEAEENSGTDLNPRLQILPQKLNKKSGKKSKPSSGFIAPTGGVAARGGFRKVLAGSLACL